MTSPRKILVTRQHIASAGGIKPALDEAHSLASLQMTPLAMTAYEAVGSAPAEADGSDVLVQIEVQDEQELREALLAGAQAVLLVNRNPADAQRLVGLAKGLHKDCLVEIRNAESPNNA